MWGLRYLNALLSGRMWGPSFCSTERRLGTIDCSLDRWQGGGEEELGMFFLIGTNFVEEVDFFKKYS